MFFFIGFFIFMLYYEIYSFKCKRFLFGCYYFDFDTHTHIKQIEKSFHFRLIF